MELVSPFYSFDLSRVTFAISHIYTNILFISCLSIWPQVCCFRGLSYSHKLSGYPDPSKAFVVLQMLKGYGKLHARLDSRLPITIPILHKLLQSASLLPLSKYQILMFQAMCSTAFFGFLRVGEITFSATTPPPIQIHQLTKLVNDAHEVVGFKIKFLTFKHNYNQPPFYLVISP